MGQDRGVLVSARRFDAVIFDMDGVVTDTARVHAAAWKRLFDEFLQRRAQQEGGTFQPFDIERDYRLAVDGRPRNDGAPASFASRGISLPWGDPSDPPDRETVCGLGNRKNLYFLAHIWERGVEVYPTTVELVRRLRECGLRTAVFSASKNATEVLQAAGVLSLFEVKVDGRDAEALGLPGKPDPAMLLEAARRLGVPPQRAVIVEDAIAGVRAGRAGGFGLVIGVDREGLRGELLASGADAVVSDLAEVTLTDCPP